MDFKKIPHYRPRCVADFKIAKKGSINLDEYAEDFRDNDRINALTKEIGEIVADVTYPERSFKLTTVARQLEHESARASFPYNYTNYGVSIFGSARLDPSSKEFKEVIEISRALVSKGKIDILTGGGPGVMEAANQGAALASDARQAAGKKTKSESAGILVKLPFEENPNPHLNSSSSHSTFGTRLNEFADRSNATISWDGGGGTDLENAFLYQLKQVGHLEADFPIMMKKKAWERIQETKMKVLYHMRLIEDNLPLVSPNDLNLIDFYDHPDDVIQAVLEHYNLWKKNVWSKLDDASKTQIMEGRK